MRSNHTNRQEDRSEFRLIPTYSIDHNARRLRVYVERLRARMRSDPKQRNLLTRIRLKTRRTRATKGAHA